MKKDGTERLVQKGTAKQASLVKSRRSVFPEKLGCVPVREFGFFQSVDEAHRPLGRVRDSHVVVLALCRLLGKAGGKGGVPETNILGGVVEGKAQISAATLLHVSIAIGKLLGLVCRGRGKRSEGYPPNFSNGK